MQLTEDSFLEPPHYHNPNDLSQYIFSPTLLIGCERTELTDCVEAVYISTSVVFASLQRLRILYREMAQFSFTDLPLKLNTDKSIDIEVHSFNAGMRFNAEKHYFDEEVAPDWRCKASVLDSRLSHFSSTILNTWWAALKTLASTWIEESQELKVIDTWKDGDAFAYASHDTVTRLWSTESEMKKIVPRSTSLTFLPTVHSSKVSELRLYQIRSTENCGRSLEKL